MYVAARTLKSLHKRAIFLCLFFVVYMPFYKLKVCSVFISPQYVEEIKVSTLAKMSVFKCLTSTETVSGATDKHKTQVRC